MLDRPPLCDARLGAPPRKCYVHPEVPNSYMDGNLVLEIKSQAESELQSAVGSLKPEEAAVLAMLRGRLAREAERPAKRERERVIRQAAGCAA
jgi:DNA topoisomerase I